MRKPYRKVPHLAIASLVTIWSFQAIAQDSNKSDEQWRKDIEDLKLQVEQLQKQASRDESSNKTISDLKEQDETLAIGGGVVAEYQFQDYATKSQEQGGSLILDYFMLTVDGKLDNGISYAADYRWSDVNFRDGQYLHYGWAA